MFLKSFEPSPVFLASLQILNTIVSVVLLEPFPFVERCLNLTVANHKSVSFCIFSVGLVSKLFIVTTATPVSFETEVQSDSKSEVSSSTPSH